MSDSNKKDNDASINIPKNDTNNSNNDKIVKDSQNDDKNNSSKSNSINQDGISNTNDTNQISNKKTSTKDNHSKLSVEHKKLKMTEEEKKAKLQKIELLNSLINDIQQSKSKNNTNTDIKKESSSVSTNIKKDDLNTTIAKDDFDTKTDISTSLDDVDTKTNTSKQSEVTVSKDKKIKPYDINFYIKGKKQTTNDKKDNNQTKDIILNDNTSIDNTVNNNNNTAIDNTVNDNTNTVNDNTIIDDTVNDNTIIDDTVNDNEKYINVNNDDTDHTENINIDAFDKNKSEKKENDIETIRNKSVSAFASNSSNIKIKTKSANRKIFSNGHSKLSQKTKLYLIGLSILIILVMLLIIINPFKKSDSKNQTVISNESSQATDEPKQEQEKTDEEQESNVTLFAAGDNLFHENIAESGKEGSTYSFEHLYSKIQDDITKADIAVINQETVFATKTTGYPRFGSPKEIAPSLVNVGFDVVLHATNHTADQGPGKEGLNLTFDTWKQYPSMKVLGINETEEDTHKITVIEKNNIKIAMLNYTYGLNGLSINPSYLVNIFKGNEDRVIEDVKNAKKQADFVAVFMHWGTEYQLNENDDQRQWAKLLSDNGADLIVGAHPHVVQPVKWITSDTGHKTLCYYSLGNLICSQDTPTKLLGATAGITITKKGNTTSITNATVTPTFMHIVRPASKDIAAYRLSEYNYDLAKKHLFSNCRSKSALDNVRETAREVLGSDTCATIPIESDESQTSDNNNEANN